MNTKIHKWFDKLQEPKRALVFLGTMSSMILVGACFGEGSMLISIIIVGMFGFSRLIYLHHS